VPTTKTRKTKTRATYESPNQAAKKSNGGIGQQQQRQQVHEIIPKGGRALDEVTWELGRQVAEFIFYAEREELAGPDYQPRREGL